MYIDLWNLVQIFPNLSIADLEKYRKSTESFSIYRPKIEETTREKYGINWQLASNYLECCYLHRAYEVNFSSHADVNEKLSSFYMDTDEFNHPAWTSENSKKIAHYMSKEPLVLPSFIIENAMNILAQLMGYESFRRVIEIEGNYGRKSEFHDQVFIQCLGLRHLSVFCAFLEDLVKEGVNVEALPIRSNYSLYASYEGLFRTDLEEGWYDSKNGRSRKQNEYHEKKQYDFDMKAFFSFHSITEFLNRVCYCIENNFSVVSSIGYFHNWEMPNPSTIDFANKNYIETFEKNFYERAKGKFSTIAYEEYFSGEQPNCTYFIPYEREKKNKEKGERIKAIPYLKHMLALLKEKDKNTKMEISILKKVYSYLARKNREHQKQFSVLEEMISLLPIIEEMKLTTNYFTEEELNYIKLRQEDFLCQEEKPEEECSLSFEIKKQMGEYQQEIERLTEELDYQKSQNSKLEEKIQEYLKNGGPIPLKSLSSKEDVEYAKIVLEKNKCYSFLEKARKAAFSIILYGISGTALLNFANKKWKEFYPEVSFQIEEESPFSFENILNEDDSFTDLLKAKDLFSSQKPILKEPKKEANEPFLFGNYATSTTIPYYTTIYDSAPVGYTEVSGLIISYYALEQTETQLVKIATFKTQEELNAFLMINKDRNLIWKAGYYIGDEVDMLKEMMHSGKEIPHTYISFFIDYNVQKELEEEKIIIKK